MKQYLLTRSAFGAAVPVHENRHRLELLRRITVPSLAAQTNRDITWIVLTADDDPLADARRAALVSAGLHLIIGSAAGMTLRGGSDKPWGPWADHSAWGDLTLTTRLDDDDAIAPWLLAEVRDAAGRANPRRRAVWSPMDGWRIAGRMAERVHWPIPMFCTLQAPAGDRGTIFDINHLGAAKLGPVRDLHLPPAWLWIRHRNTRSSFGGTQLAGWRKKPVPIGDTLRAAFPVDWPFIESLEGKWVPMLDR